MDGDRPLGYNAFSRLEKIPSEQLFTMQAAVKELKRTAGWQVLKELLDHREREILTLLLQPTILTHEQYVAHTARIQGLRAAEVACDSVLHASKVVEQRLADAAAEGEQDGD